MPLDNHPRTETREVARTILRDLSLYGICALALFAAAGTLYWLQAWIYLLLALGHQTFLILALLRYNPHLLAWRGRVVREGTAPFDRIFIIVFLVFSLSISAIAGLDAVRYGWFPLPGWLAVPGAAIFLGSSLMGTWAMSVNPHFEMTMHIQAERGHTVCRDGPYRFIRHPGYAAWIAAAATYPFILGSGASAVPVALLIAVFVARTAVEDRFLLRNLPGYVVYAQETRYRLIPFLW